MYIPARSSQLSRVLDNCATMPLFGVCWQVRCCVFAPHQRTLQARYCPRCLNHHRAAPSQRMRSGPHLHFGSTCGVASRCVMLTHKQPVPRANACLRIRTAKTWHPVLCRLAHVHKRKYPEDCADVFARCSACAECAACAVSSGDCSGDTAAVTVAAIVQVVQACLWRNRDCVRLRLLIAESACQWRHCVRTMRSRRIAHRHWWPVRRMWVLRRLRWSHVRS